MSSSNVQEYDLPPMFLWLIIKQVFFWLIISLKYHLRWIRFLAPMFLRCFAWTDAVTLFFSFSCQLIFLSKTWADYTSLIHIPVVLYKQMFMSPKLVWNFFVPAECATFQIGHKGRLYHLRMVVCSGFKIICCLVPLSYYYYIAVQSHIGILPCFCNLVLLHYRHVYW